ncbi:MAG: hypothetical protein K5907_04390 [Treponema sp.]|nr:hypothetical protein [Treponema sp.]
MVNGNVLVHTSQLSRMGLQQQVLKDGSQVLVRIIADKGGGRYEGSVAGARVTISSKMALKPGATFTAAISSKNGQILLTPRVQTDQNAVIKNFELSILNDEHLAAFIKSLNLPSDEMTFHLLQQMKQLGMKLEPSLLSRFHNLAIKYKGKELRAAELLMILAKKGLDFSEEEIFAFLNELSWEEKDNNNNQNDEFFLLNKANNVKESWQFLPYQISSQEEVLAQGCISVLPDEGGRLKLLNLECRWLSTDNEYLFSIEYEGGKCRRIKLNAGDSEEKTKRLANALERKLIAAGKSIKVYPEVKEMLEGTACASEDFYVFRGDV